MATSKWLEAPIMAAGAASSYFSLRNFAAAYPRAKINIVWIKSGIAIHRIVNGFAVMTSHFKLNSKTSVSNRAQIVIGVRTPKNFSLNQVSPLAAMIDLREK